MRIGVTLPVGQEIELAATAEAAGIPFVHVSSPPGSEAAVAAAVAATTSAARIIVGIHIGDENPVTLAEEVAVLDNMSNGRVAVIAELGSLPAEAAIEDVSLLRAALGARPLGHRGLRWQVPARLAGHVAPSTVIVTPAPAQLTVPVWVAGDTAAAVSVSLSVPVVATATDALDPQRDVCPARDTLGGDLETDRQRVVEWSRAGATHLLCTLDAGATIASVARWLIPEVGMVDFPRVVADAPLPAAWPTMTSSADRTGT